MLRVGLGSLHSLSWCGLYVDWELKSFFFSKAPLSLLLLAGMLASYTKFSTRKIVSNDCLATS